MTIRAIPVALVVALAPAAALAATVQTYTRGGELSRGEGLITTRGFVPGADPRFGPLLTAQPFPDNRTDSPSRVENGRLWSPRYPIGSRSIISELPLGFPGAAGFGAPPEANNAVIFVDTSVPGLPPIAISPFVDQDEQTVDLVIEQIPFIGSSTILTSNRRDQIIRDLREARNQWLEEQGFILNVRTHVNAATLARGGQAATTPAPSAVIRRREAGSRASLDTDRPEPVVRVRRSSQAEAGGAIASERVSVPSPRDLTPRIVVAPVEPDSGEAG